MRNANTTRVRALESFVELPNWIQMIELGKRGFDNKNRRQVEVTLNGKNEAKSTRHGGAIGDFRVRTEKKEFLVRQEEEKQSAPFVARTERGSRVGPRLHQSSSLTARRSLRARLCVAEFWSPTKAKWFQLEARQTRDDRDDITFRETSVEKINTNAGAWRLSRVTITFGHVCCIPRLGGSP